MFFNRKKKVLSTTIMAAILTVLFDISSGSMECVRAEEGAANGYEYVYIGNYLQDDTNKDGVVDNRDEKQRIKWRILSRDGDDAYVLAEKVLDYKQYNEELEDVNWKACSIRSWLNEDFYNSAFDVQEQTAIIEQTLINEKDSNNEIDTDGLTIDKVFLPSVSDLTNSEYGFSHDDDKLRVATATDYVKQQGLYTDESTGACWWLLRFSEVPEHPVAHVHVYGYLCRDGLNYINHYDGVRPAMHIDLSSPYVHKVHEGNGYSLEYKITDEGVIVTKGIVDKIVDLKIPAQIEDKNVISIDEYAFRSCQNLRSVTIPEGVLEIGNGVFANCNGLKSITIPQSVKSIGQRVLAFCGSTIYVYNNSSTELNLPFEGFEEWVDGQDKEKHVEAVSNGVALNLYWWDKDVALKFDDINFSDWFYSAVQYAYDNGVMNGTGESFEPSGLLKREQFVRVLYNISGQPSVEGLTNSFLDVKNEWYHDAVLWATANEVTNGIGDGKFGVGNNITREQLVTMTYRYAEKNGYNLTVTSGVTAPYSDSAKVSDWAKKAFDWAVSQGIVTGKGTGSNPADLSLDPQGTATRAECAAIMMRLLQKNGK